MSLPSSSAQPRPTTALPSPTHHERPDISSQLPAPILSHVFRWLVLVTAAVGSCFGAYRLALFVSRPAAAPQVQLGECDGLVVPISALDFGEAWEESAFSWTIPVANSTAADIQVFDFAVGCTCAKVEPRSLCLRPGEKKDVRLTLDLTKRNLAEMGLARRPFSMEIRPIRRDGGAQPSSWTLQGEVKARVTLDTQFLHFGEEAVQGQPPTPRKVLATAHVPLRRLHVVASPPLAKVEVVPVSGRADQFALWVSPLSTLPTGPFQLALAIDVVDEYGERQAAVKLPVAGTMQPAVRALPARLFLGARPVGARASATTVLQVPVGEAWVVEHIQADSPDVEVETVSVAGLPAGRCFRVVQRIAKQGDHASVVRFVVRKPSAPAPETLSVEVSYRGEAAPRKGVTP